MAAIFKLEEKVIFSDRNKLEGNNEDHASETVTIEKLKYKHIRAVLKYPESEQMHHLLMMTTGLSENDAGELLPQDAARIVTLLHQEISKFNQLSQNIANYSHEQ